MKKSNATTEQVLDKSNKNGKITENVDAVRSSIKNFKNADNKTEYLCVLCEEKFAEHSLMIEHFR